MPRAERDAKSKIVQVVKALHYLNTGLENNKKIIHFDLKPGVLPAPAAV